MSAHIVINTTRPSVFRMMEARIKEGLGKIPNPEKVRVYTCREIEVDTFPPDTPLVQVEFSRRQGDSRFAMKLTSFLTTLNPKPSPHSGTIWGP